MMFLLPESILLITELTFRLSLEQRPITFCDIVMTFPEWLDVTCPMAWSPAEIQNTHQTKQLPETQVLSRTSFPPTELSRSIHWGATARTGSTWHARWHNYGATEINIYYSLHRSYSRFITHSIKSCSAELDPRLLTLICSGQGGRLARLWHHQLPDKRGHHVQRPARRHPGRPPAVWAEGAPQQRDAECQTNKQVLPAHAHG